MRSGLTLCRWRAQVRLLNIGELRKDAIGALTFGAEIPPYKDGMLPSSPKLRYAYPTAPTWQVVILPRQRLLAALHLSLSESSILQKLLGDFCPARRNKAAAWQV